MKNVKMNGAVSIDTDSLDLFYYAFKKKRLNDNDVTYKTVLPRFLDFLKRKRITATFFIIGSHIKTPYHRKILNRMIDEGHELANHTFNHRLNFSSLSNIEKEKEIIKCERIIEKATGIKPIGFRAPGWDINSQTIKILEKRNYWYDSSVFPSYYNAFAWAYLFRRNKNFTCLKSSINSLKQVFAPLTPYHPGINNLYCKGNSNIIELPMTVTPILRIPFYTTFLFATKSKLLFDHSLKRIYQSELPLNYILHSIDLYDKDKDAVNDRIKNLKHPTISECFENKMTLYHYIFERFNKYYEISTLKDLTRFI